VRASHGYAEQVAAERPVYGRTTGVGSNRDVVLADPDSHVLQLLRSHATAAGPSRAPERVRAMLAVRLNQLAAGGSGASLSVVEALEAMLQADALPDVREYGSVGTGDLAALAGTALALLGERPTSAPLPAVVPFGVHDALPFMSSNAAAIADAALACVELQDLSRAVAVTAALTFVAIDGNLEAFSPVIKQVTPFAGAAQVCRWMRGLVGSPAAAARIQDPFGLRTLPQVHGLALDCLALLDDVVRRTANAPSENPVLLPPTAAADGRPETPGALAHHGGFHAAYLGTAVSTALVTATQSAQLVQSRLACLMEPRITGLAPFLGDGVPGASGAMLLEYVAASALAELRGTPPVVQSAVLSRGAEDDASFASTAARRALDATGSLRVLLACELVAAVRALRARDRAGRGTGSAVLEQALALCAELPDDPRDRDLTPDLDLAGQLLTPLAELIRPDAGTPAG
jgi:histidine ammonia-lyase